MKYFGTYYHNLDAKNRLLVPSKLKNILSKKIYLLHGFDGCVSLYDEDSFETFTNKLEQYSFNQAKGRAYVRSLLASVVELEFDKVGRILIPTNIYNKYALTKELAVVGVGDHIELWNKTKWEEYLNSCSNFEEIAEEL